MGTEWELAAFSAFFVLLAGIVSVWASARWRREDRVTTVEKDVGEVKEDIAHVEGFLEVKTGYRPRIK